MKSARNEPARLTSVKNASISTRPRNLLVRVFRALWRGTSSKRKLSEAVTHRRGLPAIIPWQTQLPTISPHTETTASRSATLTHHHTRMFSLDGVHINSHIIGLAQHASSEVNALNQMSYLHCKMKPIWHRAEKHHTSSETQRKAQLHCRKWHVYVLWADLIKLYSPSNPVLYKLEAFLAILKPCKRNKPSKEVDYFKNKKDVSFF